MKFAKIFVIGVGTYILARVLFAIFAPIQAGDHGSVGTVCISNLKQLSLVQLQYAADNDDHFTSSSRWMDSTYPYTKNWDSYHCPSLKSKDEYGYSMSQFMSLAKQTDDKLSTEKPLVFESATLTKNAHGYLQDFPSPARHEQGVVVTFADGRAEFLPRAKK
ncbi:hypothetical protein BH11ARM1_BH11ARM1_18080 [soil metagenome]